MHLGSSLLILNRNVSQTLRRGVLNRPIIENGLPSGSNHEGDLGLTLYEESAVSFGSSLGVDKLLFGFLVLLGVLLGVGSVDFSLLGSLLLGVGEIIFSSFCEFGISSSFLLHVLRDHSAKS